MIVCVCKGVTDRSVKQMACRGLDTMRLIGDECGLGRQCGRCVPYARNLLKELRLDDERKPKEAAESSVI